MECLVALLSHRPLAIHFSLVNPARAESARFVPRTLAPVGLFVTLEVHEEGETEPLYRSGRAKAKPKLHPEREESYISLEPGYSFGAVLTVDVDELDLPSGRYRLSAAYDNGPFTGPRARPTGSLACSREVSFEVR